MKASLIVAASGRDTHLVNTLRCALAQRYTPLEIVVVDSADSRSLIAEDFLERKQSRIRHLVLPKRSRLALYNHAMTHASGDVLIFITDHASFGPRFVDQHMACYLDAHMGAVQGRVVTRESAASRVPVLSKMCQLKGQFNCSASGRTNRIGEYNFSMLRQAAEQVGLFDEQMDNSMEWASADYGLRCHQAGWHIRFESHAELVPHGKQSVASERLRRQQRLESHHLAAQALLAYRHLSPLMRWAHRLMQRWQGWVDIQQRQNDAWRTVAAEADAIAVHASETSSLMVEVMTPYAQR